MQKKSRAFALSLPSFALLAATLTAPAALAQERQSFRVGYVIYVGFMPLAWADQSGVLEKWADEYGIEIELLQINDYVGSINQFIAGDLDAVAVAGMDALTMPAAGGVDTSVFLLTDYSDGNDMLISKTAETVEDLVGEDVYLLQYSVSHYLLSRAVAMAGIDEPWSVRSVNISDAEIAAAYLTQPDLNHVSTWNPMAAELLSQDGSNLVFDSSDIPGEIMDVFIARTETLAEYPDLAKALTGAWYEAMEVMTAGGPEAEEMLGIMASAMGTDVAGLQAQLDTTFFFTTPGSAAEFLEAESTGEIWDLVRTFSFEQGLFGQGASSVDDIGIAVGGGAILGDPENVMLRMDPSFAAAAAAGEL